MSPILNETRNWTGDVGEIETEAAVVDPATGQEIKPCTRVKHAFMREEAVAARISAGSMLYKFNGFSAFPRPGAGPNEAVSPWWSPYGEFEIQGMGRDTGYGAKVKTAREKGVSLREWARHTSAVKEDWNTLQWVVFIKLRTTIIGYWGGIEGKIAVSLTGSLTKTSVHFFVGAVWKKIADTFRDRQTCPAEFRSSTSQA